MKSKTNADQPTNRQKTGNTITIGRNVTYLPHHLMYEILLRSPAESLLRFKIVCKDWCSLIKDMSFVKQYNDHHKGNNDSMGIVLMTATTTDFPEGCDLANFNKLHEYDVGCDQAEEFELPLNTDDYPMSLTTCNGLVCFCKEFPVFLWNPVTREFIMLSKPEFEKEVEFVHSCGFGYDAVNNKFKVVQFLSRLSDYSLECMVLNLGTNMSWRRIPRQQNFVTPMLKYFEDGPKSVFFEGTIYWCSYTDILCFDVSAEIFKVIPAPASVQSSTRDGRHTMTCMVELDKSICFVELYVCGGPMDIWMMQKDSPDMKTPWVMGYNIDMEAISSDVAFDIRPVCIRGKKIYFNCKNGLACYDKETKVFELVFNKAPDMYNYGVAYTKSILCLKDVVGSKCVRAVHVGECEACRSL